MANTFNLGNGNWAQKTEKLLAYNAENDNYKPLPFDFDRASTATRVNKQGLIETVGVDKPRIDFLNNTKGHLLLQPQSTNLIPYSQEFTGWNLTNAVETPNALISPDGTQNASKFVTNNNGVDIKYASIPVIEDTTYTFSFYCNYIGGLGLQGRFYDNINGANIEYYDYMSQLEEGKWKRVTRTFTTPIGCTNIQVWYLAASSSNPVTAYYWGAQLEEGYLTSYIPTQGSAVTRSAETGVDCLLPNGTIIDNSTATVYFEFEALADDASNRWISFEEVGTAIDNQFEIRLAGGSDLLQIVTRSSGGGQDVVMTKTLTDITDNNKIALNYNGLNWKLAVNGTITDTATAARLFNDNIEKIKFSRYTNTNHFYGKVKDLRVYNTALTDAELIALTSL